ncbi:MAG: PrsW family intramembrane metalloprotease [Treponema sp.]|nr:PrsW family intramembrane metalloprotease [Treponema sp.]
MSGLPVLFFLILASALPVFPVLLWYRLSRFPLSPAHCSFALLSGAAALFPALLLQRLVSGIVDAHPGIWNPAADIFIRIAFTEEAGRLLTLLILFLFSGDLKRPVLRNPDTGEASDPSRAAGLTARGAALGLLAGLGFAMLESAAYGAVDFRATLYRAFTAAPLHAACGARIGSALLLFGIQPRRPVFRFFSAVVIHGVYDFMIIRPGISSLLAILIALFALASSALEIRSGMKLRSGPQ